MIEIIVITIITITLASGFYCWYKRRCYANNPLLSINLL